jgi:hypothetical protein
MELQPIETAPKDGRLIVLCDEHDKFREIARWLEDERRWVRRDGTAVPTIPMHWMPYCDERRDA